MPFDPNLPQENTLIDAAQMRSQLQGLKALIDAILTLTAAQVDGVNTANPSDPANVAVSVSGNDGVQGPPGEVSNQQLNDAISGTSNNSNAVSTLDTPFTNDLPTLADMETMRAKFNELVLALRR